MAWPAILHRHDEHQFLNHVFPRILDIPDSLSLSKMNHQPTASPRKSIGDSISPSSASNVSSSTCPPSWLIVKGPSRKREAQNSSEKLQISCLERQGRHPGTHNVLSSTCVQGGHERHRAVNNFCNLAEAELPNRAKNVPVSRSPSRHKKNASSIWKDPLPPFMEVENKTCSWVEMEVSKLGLFCTENIQIRTGHPEAVRFHRFPLSPDALTVPLFPFPLAYQSKYFTSSDKYIRSVVKLLTGTIPLTWRTGRPNLKAEWYWNCCPHDKPGGDYESCQGPL